MSRRLTKEQFIQKAKKIFSDYGYSKVKYINNRTKVIIICPIHGEFTARPDNILSGMGCKKCANDYTANLKSKDTKWFISKMKEINPSIDCSESLYTKNGNFLIARCPIHGYFKMRARTLLAGHSCQKCGSVYRKTTKEFIEEAERIHKNYDFSKVKYINAKGKVRVICKKHGTFLIAPTHILSGKGCPKCLSSKLELRTESILMELNIKYVPQKRFKGCKYKRELPFDFYLPELNICIECQGEQHYKPVAAFGGQVEHEKVLKRDSIKRMFCEQEGYILLKIPYWRMKEDQIKNIILAEIKQQLKTGKS